MQNRKLGASLVSPIGLGCMNLSHAYLPRPEREYGLRLLNEALDVGYTHLDTAALYGFGANEKLLGDAVMHRRAEFTLASKCVLGEGVDGKRGLDGRPEAIKASCEASLKRLGTDVIDLFYLHRKDKNVPIEESMGAMSELVQEGKIRDVGVSEMGADLIHKAHAVHPVAAVQTEYSLWTRNPEIAVLQACEEIGATFVAFSPVARGYLCGLLRDVSVIPEKDIRRAMPRFEPGNYAKNLDLLDRIIPIAEELDCTLAQLALAWVLAKAPHIVAIPGTTNIEHLRENKDAERVHLTSDIINRLDEVINERTVVGPRYNPGAQADVYTEEFS